jgi:hypothetical protein
MTIWRVCAHTDAGRRKRGFTVGGVLLLDEPPVSLRMNAHTDEGRRRRFNVIGE